MEVEAHKTLMFAQDLNRAIEQKQYELKQKQAGIADCDHSIG